MSQLTLSQIEMLLHYHYSPQDHPDVVSGVARLPIDGLLKEGLLGCDRSTSNNRTYETTARAEAYIEAIRALPLPVEETRWVMP